MKKRLYSDGTIECLSEKINCFQVTLYYYMIYPQLLLDDVPSIIDFINNIDRKSSGVKNILKY